MVDSNEHVEFLTCPLIHSKSVTVGRYTYLLYCDFAILLFCMLFGPSSILPYYHSGVL